MFGPAFRVLYERQGLYLYVEAQMQKGRVLQKMSFIITIGVYFIHYSQTKMLFSSKITRLYI
jgi:hypothetical protein